LAAACAPETAQGVSAEGTSQSSNTITDKTMEVCATIGSTVVDHACTHAETNPNGFSVNDISRVTETHKLFRSTVETATFVTSQPGLWVAFSSNPETTLDSDRFKTIDRDGTNPRCKVNGQSYFAWSAVANISELGQRVTLSFPGASDSAPTFFIFELVVMGVDDWYQLDADGDKRPDSGGVFVAACSAPPDTMPFDPEAQLDDAVEAALTSAPTDNNPPSGSAQVTCKVGTKDDPAFWGDPNQACCPWERGGFEGTNYCRKEGKVRPSCGEIAAAKNIDRRSGALYCWWQDLAKARPDLYPASYELTELTLDGVTPWDCEKCYYHDPSTSH